MRVDKNTLSQPASQLCDSTLLTFKLRVKKDNRIIKSWLKKFLKLDRINCAQISRSTSIFVIPLRARKSTGECLLISKQEY